MSCENNAPRSSEKEYALLRRRGVIVKALICLAAMMGVIGTTSAFATDYYVATNGSDNASGTSTNTAFATLAHAVDVLTADGAGGTIYVCGGKYNLTAKLSLSQIGTAANPYRIRAYSADHPILNCGGVGSGTDGIGITGSYWQLYGLDITNAPHNAIRVQGGSLLGNGSCNTFEFCSFHHCGNSGFSIGASTTPTTYLAGSNLVLNCDAYRNFDPPAGGNADGFSVKYYVGPDNTFRGCRSWENSDDGWDLFGATASVLIDTCWTWRNGSNVWGAAYNSSFNGNGNGFKMGGNYVATPHRLVRSVSYQNWGKPGNGGKGIDQNNNTGSLTIDNNTSWGNRAEDINMNTTPTTSGVITVRNNLVISGTTNIQGSATQISNSWQVISSPGADTNDVLSMDASLLAAPRQADGSLPVTALVHPVPNGRLVDKGANIGEPFFGSAPDLGAYETGGGTPVAMFTGNPTSGVAPLTVTFADISTGTPPLSLSWNLGDNTTTNTAGGAIFTHTYAAGTYTVTLTASNSAGTSTLVSNNVITVTASTTPLQAWQLRYFNCTNCPQADPSADPDGDGLNNLAEFLAGSDPTNSTSGLHIISVAPQSNGDMLITWKTAGGHTNAVQVTSGDANGGYNTNFMDITVSPHIIISGSGDVTTNYIDGGGATNVPSRFYRIRLVP
jgi:PKD repeat protein